MVPAQHPARIIQAVRADIGLQQRELDQVVSVCDVGGNSG